MKYTKIKVKINTKDKPPYFMGSQIRGAFGYALRNVFGDEKENENLYYKFYMEENTQRPFRFDFKLGSYEYNFSIFLFNEYCDEVFNIITSLHEMLTNIGFGNHKNKRLYKDFKIYVNDKVIYKDGNLKEIDKYRKKLKIKEYLKVVQIKFETPLRIKKEGKFVRNSQIELEDILTSVFKRLNEFNQRKVYKLDYIPKYEYITKDLFFKDLSRYSNVQNKSMKLGGLVGVLEVKKLDKRSFELLKIGELIGVGKETSFGLGKIKVEDIND